MRTRADCCVARTQKPISAQTPAAAPQQLAKPTAAPPQPKPLAAAPLITYDADGFPNNLPPSVIEWCLAAYDYTATRLLFCLSAHARCSMRFSQGVPCRALVRWCARARSRSELSFAAGELIALTEKDDDGWCVVCFFRFVLRRLGDSRSLAGGVASRWRHSRPANRRATFRRRSSMRRRSTCRLDMCKCKKILNSQTHTHTQTQIARAHSR